VEERETRNKEIKSMNERTDIEIEYWLAASIVTR